MKYTWKSSFCKNCWFLHLGWRILPCYCLPQGYIYVSRQRIPFRREGNICLPSYDTNPKPIPRARSLPRCRCARKRIGMGSSASINFPSRNDEPGAFIPRRLRATLGFPFSISSLVGLFCIFFSFLCLPPRPHVLVCRRQQRGGLCTTAQKHEPVQSGVCLRYRRINLIILVILT